MTPVPVAAVAVIPLAASVQVGGTVQLATATKDSAGAVLGGRAVTWASGNLAVATVSGSGLVAGVAAGTATITATSEGKSGTATVTVTSLPPPPPPPPAPVASVVVSPASASVPVGATVQLTASLKDASGNVLTGRTIAWGTSAAGVATVSASGLVTGSAAGTATSEGKSGTALIVVASAPPPGTNPNEPSGYTRFAEHDFSTPITQSTPSATGLMGLWAIDDPTLLPNMTYAVDLGAPRSAPQVFQGKFPAGLQGGFTSIKWQGWDAAADGNSYGTEMREIYLSMWIKIVGPDYENQPVAGTKMGFFGYAEPKSSPGNQGVPKIKVDSPQIRSDFNLRFEQQNTVDRILDQNVDTRRLMTCGVWHRWEMVLRLNTLGGGGQRPHLRPAAAPAAGGTGRGRAAGILGAAVAAGAALLGRHRRLKDPGRLHAGGPYLHLGHQEISSTPRREWGVVETPHPIFLVPGGHCWYVPCAT